MIQGVKGTNTSKAEPAATAPPQPSPPVPSTGNVTLDAMGSVINQTAAPFQSAPPASQGTLGAVNHYVGGVMAVVGAPFELMDAGFAAITSGLAAVMPGFPAASMAAPHLGTPHGHAHPPSLVPPAPTPVPLPSIGTTTAACCTSVLISNMPAVRASDIGPAPTCVSFSPMFEVYTGSSNTFIGGSRASRMTDITRHCNPASAAGAFGMVMAGVGVALGASTAVASATEDTGGDAGAAVAAAASAASAAAQAAADAVAMAMSAFLGKDPGVAPAMGAVMFGNPTVLIGGFPVPDLLDLLGGLVKAAKKAKKAAKNLGKKAKKLKKQICLDPSEPISVVTGEVYNDFLDIKIDPTTGWNWERHYRSSWSEQVGELGRGFSHIYERKLLLRRRSACFCDFDGVEVDFPRHQDNTYGGNTFGYRLEQKTAELFSLHLPDGSSEYLFKRLSSNKNMARLVRVSQQNKPPIQLEYNLNGQLIKCFREFDDTLTEVCFSYHANACIKNVTRRVNSSEPKILASYQYDNDLNLISHTNTRGGIYRYSYQNHRMTRAEDPRNYGFNWTYDHQGRCTACHGDDGLLGVNINYGIGQTTVKEADGGIWIYLYNDDGIVTKVIDPYEGVKHYKVDGLGIICEQTNPNGQKTQWLYDDYGHHYARQDCWGNIIPIENEDLFPSSGRELHIPQDSLEIQFGLDKKVDANNASITNSLQYIVCPASVKQYFSKAFEHSQSHPDELIFDESGDEICRRSNGKTSSIEYSALGEALVVTDGDGKKTRNEYASWELLMSTHDANQSRTRFRYDHRQKIIAIEDPCGHVVQYVRDKCGRIEKLFNEQELEEYYEHDKAGRVIASYDGNKEQLVGYSYGENGLCESRTLSNGVNYKYSYDDKGNITSASTDEIDIQLLYNSDKKVIKDKQNNRGIQITQATSSHWKSLLLDKFATEYHQQAGGFTEIRLPNGEFHYIRILPNGGIERRHASGLHHLSVFDESNRLSCTSLWRDGFEEQTPWIRQYRYSNEDDLIEIQDSAKGEKLHRYDDGHRLRAQMDYDGRQHFYEYDAAGNILKNPHYSWLRYDKRHQLLEASNAQFQYNRRYNLEKHTENGCCKTYSYDSQDRLVKVSWDDGRPDWTAAYDGLGRRLYKAQGDKKTIFYWEGDRLAAEQEEGGCLRIYTYPNNSALVPIIITDYESGNCEPQSGIDYTIFTDQIGLPVYIYNPSAELVWSTDWADPYGHLDLNEQNQLEFSLRFPGHYYDAETGLHYNRFRYYDPLLGRYLQSDPMGQAGGIHIYAYPSNPLADVDVFGLVHKKKAKSGDSDADGAGPKKKGAEGDDACTNKKGDKDTNEMAEDAPEKVCTSGCPISLVTGEEILSLVDFKLDGPLPLSWTRIYRSSKRQNNGMGFGWSHTFIEWLEINNDRIELHAGTNRTIPFDLPEVGYQCRNITEKYCLKRIASNEYKINRISPGVQVYYHFKAIPGTERLVLSKISDSIGNNYLMHYQDAILVSIVSSWGDRWQIKYENNLLSQVVWQRTDCPPKTLVSYRYSSNTDLCEAIDPIGNSEKYQFNHHLITKRTLKSGYSFQFEWDGTSPTAKCLRNWGDPINGQPTYNYTFAWDELGSGVRISDTRGAVETYEFNEQGLPIYHRDPEGGETHYTYDDSGNLLEKEGPEGHVDIYEYNDEGLLQEHTDTRSLVTQLLRDKQGNIIEVTDPLSQVWKREYNNLGQITCQINPENESFIYSYNDIGLVNRITNPTGQEWHYIWNSYAQLLAVRNPLGNHTRYSYNESGDLVKTTYPDGRFTQYNFDPKGNCTHIKEPDNRIQQYKYNELALLTEFDDGTGRKTQYFYDGLSQISQRIDAAGQKFKYHYDGERNLVGLTNQKNERYQLKYDLKKQLIEEIGFDGRIQRYFYNQAGHLIQSEDISKDGKISLRTIQYERDSDGRLLKQSFIDQKNEESTILNEFNYDPLGRLQTAKNSDIELAWEYDGAGRTLTETQGNSLIKHQYENNRRTSTIYPNGKEVRYRFNSIGAFIEAHYEDQKICDIQRDQLGRETHRKLGNEINTQYSYDPQGRLLQQVSTRINSPPNQAHIINKRQYHYDVYGNLNQIDDALRGTTNYHYDRLDQLVQVEGQAPERFVYDPAGNILSEGGSDRFDHTNDQATGNQLKFYGDAHYAYDDFGNRIYKFVGKDKSLTTQYTYNKLDQLISVKNYNLVTKYKYDPLGRRIKKENKKEDIQFTWNGQVLCEETKLRGNKEFTKNYIYEPFGFKPLAFTKNENIYHFHLDHLGTPQEITNSDGKLVWAIQYRAYGNLAISYINEIENNIRFQGQYFDEESGLHYNRFRYYDPDNGVFLSQDPIGLLAGENAYKYTRNPISFIDPLGLAELYDVGTYSGLNGGDHVGDGLQAHELIRHEFLVQEGLTTKSSRMADNPSIALDLDHHTRGPAKDSRGVGGAHHHETQIRASQGLGKNEFKSTVDEEIAITSEALRRAGVPEDKLNELETDARRFYADEVNRRNASADCGG